MTKKYVAYKTMDFMVNKNEYLRTFVRNLASK